MGAAPAERGRHGDLLSAAAVAGSTAATAGLDVRTSVVLSGLSAVVWAPMLFLNGGYRVRHAGAGPKEFQAVVRVAVTLVAVLDVAVLDVAVLDVAVLDLAACATRSLLPRRWILVAIPVAALITSVVRYTLRHQLHRERARGGR